jgi:hypothetical protein
VLAYPSDIARWKPIVLLIHASTLRYPARLRFVHHHRCSIAFSDAQDVFAVIVVLKEDIIIDVLSSAIPFLFSKASHIDSVISINGTFVPCPTEIGMSMLVLEPEGVSKLMQHGTTNVDEGSSEP